MSSEAAKTTLQITIDDGFAESVIRLPKDRVDEKNFGEITLARYLSQIDKIFFRCLQTGNALCSKDNLEKLFHVEKISEMSDYELMAFFGLLASRYAEEQSAVWLEISVYVKFALAEIMRGRGEEHRLVEALHREIGGICREIELRERNEDSASVGRRVTVGGQTAAAKQREGYEGKHGAYNELIQKRVTEDGWSLADAIREAQRLGDTRKNDAIRKKYRRTFGLVRENRKSKKNFF